MSDTDKINRTFNSIRISNNSDDEYVDDIQVKKYKYPAKDGQDLEFDITPDACQRFGFFFGQLVSTPSGPAKVIGVRNGHLWFHIEKDIGATYWDNGKDNKSLIEDLKIKLVENQFLEIECKVKAIQYNDRTVQIVLNENKPQSMLVAIANVLLLLGKITFDTEDKNKVKMSQIGALVYKYMEGQCKSDKEKQNALNKYREDELQLLIYSGVSDVNVKFSAIDQFEMKSIYNIFNFVNIKLYHGWIYSENEEGYDIIMEQNLTHHDLEAKMIRFIEIFPTMSIQFERTVKDFLAGEQLTYDGYRSLKEKLENNQLCVFYRNNQFQTLRKQDNELYTLEVGQNHSNTAWNKVEII
ncbi:hypothetical protein PPL_02556 [Heterostelium album PN500]|uniref:MINDY deubiquitinase domain-containing protein n=1 Tax=Heterostelium pallidum (strain ATCC 26659 / Pp 5 / PN500) TaxID=670386 RepID=D3B2E5_HETP5|nr:hypothetical protein PPL_02556 [Heterostelium album PN500]EFA84520.1 hypothetical protein PPL_02556 [Heterostelium album PN500]|eukprot:XP_020436633.1 hypothetical protein PPL_02556 [Heterostelium album PN500]